MTERYTIKELKRLAAGEPVRAEVVRVEAAERRVERSKVGKREAGRTTKPSRSR